MSIPDPNEITMHIGRGRDARRIRFRMHALSPLVSSDFSTTSAHVNLYIDVTEDREDRVVRDWRKMELLTGGQTEDKYYSRSVISELEHRLSKLFNTKVILYLPKEEAAMQRGEVLYQLVLKPIPDNDIYGNKCTNANFTTAVRRTLNRIKDEVEPHTGRRQ